MKKFYKIFISILVLIIVSTSSLFACSNSQKAYTFIAPDGAPSLSIAKFIFDNENFSSNYKFNYQVVTSDTLGANMVNGNGDFIVIPVNLASKLYNSNIDNPYKMISVVTHGNLYIMSKDDITLNDLKGKVIGVIGQGLVPDLTFRAVLKDNGLDSLIEVVSDTTPISGKICIKYFSDASELIPMLKIGKLSIGLLGEPATTKVTKVVSDVTWYKLDLQELYDKKEKGYSQAVLMVKSSVIKENPNIVENIKSKFDDGISWVKNNIESAVNAIKSKLSTSSLDKNSLSSTVIDNCKIYWQGVDENSKNQVKTYIDKLLLINDKCAKKIADDFFI